MTLTAVLALGFVGLVLVKGHEDSRAAVGALAAETLHNSVIRDLVVLEDSELNLLVLVLDLLGGGVDLLLTLLTTTTQAKHEVKGGLLLNVVVRKGVAVLELLTGEDKTLLVRRYTFLVLNLGLDVVDGVGRLYLEGNSLPREGLYKDLHITARRQSKKVLLSNRKAVR